MTSTPATDANVSESPGAMPSPWFVVVALAAVAVNLRLAITSVPPLLDAITDDLGLSHGAAGALTTLPVLCMGILAPFASTMAHRVGAVMSVLFAMVAVVLGTASRLFGDNWVVLYVGTFVAGAGIAVAGTLLPRLVKSLFPPHRAGIVTGVYMFSMMVGAAVASAVSVPLADWLGSWQESLASWTVLALLGLVAWIPFTMRTHLLRPVETGPPARMPWRHRTAWLVAGYLSLQSVCFYTAVAWLAPTYVEQGWTATDAGYLAAAFAVGQVISGLLGPALSDRVTDLRRLLAPTTVLGLVGCLGIWLAPTSLPWIWAVVTGLGQGAAFSVALVLLVRFARTPAASGRLTGMAFLFSYSVASLGPLLLGVARDRTGSLDIVWASLVVIGIVQLAVVSTLRPGLPRVG